MYGLQNPDHERNKMAAIGLVLGVPMGGLVWWVGPDVLIAWFSRALHGEVSPDAIWWVAVAAVIALVGAALLMVRGVFRGAPR